MTKLRFLAVLAAFSATAAQAGIKATLEVDKAWLGAGDNLTARVTITNTGADAVAIPRWQVPRHEMTAELFLVTRDGEPVAYLGRVAKRPAPGPQDFLQLKPGQSVRGRTELTGHYDMISGGEYRISFRMDLAEGIFVDDLRRPADDVVSNEISVWSDAPRRQVDWDALYAPTAEAGSLTFSGGCTNGEQSAISTAVGNATTYSSNSLSYLNGKVWNTVGPRYTTWFGAADSSRFNTVKNHFSAITNAFQNAAKVVDCSCSDPYYAYVYKNQPYKIYVCNAFWSAGATGTDSKAGTLVHEMSHFSVVADTDDWAYGQSACKKLAKRPQKAIDNADSHEYFAENTPSQN
jgi:peptidyl-Lys metalloendopeptidase